MIHFGKVYGLNAEEDSFGKIYEKMTAVYSRYQQIVDSYTNKATKEAMEKMFSDMEINSDTQKNTFALTWTFLKEGMGLSDEQAAGVMGNIGWESRFSATNAQDKDGDGSFLYPGNDNSEDYNYKVLDGGEQIAYGLLQWKHEDRKGDLLETANEMGLSVGNINVQFALMQKESKGTYKDGWDNLKNCISYTAACDITQEEIEVCGGQRAERRDYAEKIYNVMLYI